MTLLTMALLTMALLVLIMAILTTACSIALMRDLPYCVSPTTW